MTMLSNDVLVVELSLYRNTPETRLTMSRIFLSAKPPLQEMLGKSLFESTLQATLLAIVERQQRRVDIEVLREHERDDLEGVHPHVRCKGPLCSPRRRAGTRSAGRPCARRENTPPPCWLR